MPEGSGFQLGTPCYARRFSQLFLFFIFDNPENIEGQWGMDNGSQAYAHILPLAPLLAFLLKITPFLCPISCIFDSSLLLVALCFLYHFYKVNNFYKYWEISKRNLLILSQLVGSLV